VTLVTTRWTIVDVTKVASALLVSDDTAPMNTETLDVRGLEAPEPFQRVVAALRDLPEGDELLVLINREPLLLFPELVRRGYGWTFGAAADGPHFTVRISRQPERFDQT
jgi:TusA-related sulfurtransferase